MKFEKEPKEAPLPLPVRIVVDDIAEDFADIYDADGDMRISNLTRDEADYIKAALNSHEELLAASKSLLRHYEQLVDSGDAGNWNPRKEKEVIALRKAISKAEAKS